MKQVFLCGVVLISLLWTNAGQAADRIITGSGVRVRSEPNVSAPEVTRLQFGAVVQEIGKTSQPEKVGQMQDYWYQVALPDGQKGWIFGGFTQPFEPAQRAAIYRELTKTRLQRKDLNFADLTDCFRFLTRASAEVTEPEIAAELKLARLQALQRSLAGQEQKSADFKAWIQEQQTNIFYNEPAGAWIVKAELFWNLQAEYQMLPIADDLAWAAALNPLGGECEGYLPCHVNQLNQTEGQYLALYPNGKSVAQALNGISAALRDFTSMPPAAYDRTDYVTLQNELKRLRASIEKTSDAKKTSVLELLDQVAKIHLQKR